MAAEALRWLDGAWSGELAVGQLPADGPNAGQRAEWWLAETPAPRPVVDNRRPVALPPPLLSADAPLLALYGLPPELAEPIGLLAEILGWRVVVRLCSGVLPARLCLAMLPARQRDEPASMLAWSPDNILNEHISREALSIMEQPLSVSRLELLLQSVGRTGEVA